MTEEHNHSSKQYQVSVKNFEFFHHDIGMGMSNKYSTIHPFS